MTQEQERERLHKAVRERCLKFYDREPTKDELELLEKYLEAGGIYCHIHLSEEGKKYRAEHGIAASDAKIGKELWDNLPAFIVPDPGTKIDLDEAFSPRIRITYHTASKSNELWLKSSATVADALLKLEEKLNHKYMSDGTIIHGLMVHLGRRKQQSNVTKSLDTKVSDGDHIFVIKAIQGG